MVRPRTTAGALRLLYPTEYSSWCAILQRCYQTSSKSYRRYGGAGVRVCKRWHNFAHFVDDMGPRPPGLTIERIRNGEGYHPDNCRWATKQEQGRNRLDNHRIRYKGETKCLVEWCEMLGISHHTMQARLKRGWTVARAFSTPLRGSGSSSCEAAPAHPSPDHTLRGAGSTATAVQAWLSGQPAPAA